MTPASVVPDGGPDVYGRTDQAASRLASPLRLTLSVEGTPASVAFVAPTEGAALGVDARDAFRLTPGAWPRAVLATTGVGDPEATALALNALPASTEGEIRLSVSVSLEGYAPGPLALSLAWQDLPEAWTATLVDDETGASVSLTEAGTYAFTVAVPETSSGVRPAALGLLPTPVAAPSASGPTAVSTHRFTIRLTRGGSVSTDTPPGDAFALRPPVPNPTRGLARVRYTLAEAGDARVSVHDLLGREVTTLADGAHTSGSHEASVDTNRLAPGVYLVRLSQGERLTTTRLTVVR
ncbi:MAG: T9SS type A sorting domain-containing protein [Bacteroidota bacterium]